nr:PREDICTED: actin-1-like [Bos mutus]
MNVPLICDYGSGFSKVGFAGTEAPLAVFPTILGKLRHETQVKGDAAEGRRGLACVFQKLLVGMEEEDWFIGNEVPKNQGKLNLLYPVSRAAITNWDDMEKIWHYSFYQMLHVAPEQHPLLMAEPPLNSISSKERLSQVGQELQRLPNEDVSELMKQAARFCHLARTPGAQRRFPRPPRRPPVLCPRQLPLTLFLVYSRPTPMAQPGACPWFGAILFETFSVPALYLANQGVLSLYASGHTAVS